MKRMKELAINIDKNGGLRWLGISWDLSGHFQQAVGRPSTGGMSYCATLLHRVRKVMWPSTGVH